MKTIDLIEADAALLALMAEYGIAQWTRCVNIEFWNHTNGSKELRVLLTAFVNEATCEGASESTWQDAIESLRINLRQYFKMPHADDENIEVVLPEVEI